MPRNILVTGGAGFIGSHLIDGLLKVGHRVRIYDNLTQQVHGQVLPNYLAREVELIRGDMRDIDGLRKVLAGIDVIYHLAAAVGVGQSMYEISNYISANTLGTANLLQVLLDEKPNLEQIIVASSMSIYGEGSYHCKRCGDISLNRRSHEQLEAGLWELQCPVCKTVALALPTKETKALDCSSFYAQSKKHQEEMVLLFGRIHGISVVSLRFFNVYGTRQSLSNPYTGVAAIFASRLLNGARPLVFEDGQQLRDFVSVHDVVRACLLAMEAKQAVGLTLNIGSGEPIPIREIAVILANELGVDITPDITHRHRSGDIRHCFADISASRTILGYEPKIRFRDGIRELVADIREQRAKDRTLHAIQKLEQYGLISG